MVLQTMSDSTIFSGIYLTNGFNKILMSGSDVMLMAVSTSSDMLLE